jgi:hypothetical protein
MAFHHETWGHGVVELETAKVKIKNAIATSTVEVMVMLVCGSFVAAGVGGKGDLRQPSLLDEKTDVPVDRSEAQPRDQFLGRALCFSRGKRSTGFRKNLAKGFSLHGFTQGLHPSILPWAIHRRSDFLV